MSDREPMCEHDRQGIVTTGGRIVSLLRFVSVGWHAVTYLLWAYMGVRGEGL